MKPPCTIPDFSSRGQFNLNWNAHGDGNAQHREEFWQWLKQRGLRRRGQIMCFSVIKFSLIGWFKERGYPPPAWTRDFQRRK